ncbi:aldo/keto reductase [Flavobacterium pectinovorum]|uniref:Oxidoreductase n=1 Tax=Flavobacterium pectinovorum TaxID=29533 RepID=A0AB36P5M1_9FLAO|nr:aldo/keto reductase [Flavobacterium pectinovorum]OXB07752.1 oxidoreductase [Flavobacterium pectinovorum]SHM79338.1 Predicted oxidoreductase [Flavobacterium pectinovorum]
MNYKLLGKKTGLPVSEFALGAGSFGTAWGYGTEEKEVERIVSLYTELGGNLIDTADNYQCGESEEILGRVIASKRNELVISTKYTRGLFPVQALGTLGNHRKNMVQSVEESLRRLKTDRIDLYFVHQDDLFTPIEEIVRGLDDLVRAGKIIYGGISNFPAWRVASAATLAELRGWSAVSAIEVEYSLLQRETERELLPMAEAFGLGVMAWSPLAGGLLTGKYRKGESGRATAFEGSIPYQGNPIAEAVLDELFAIAQVIESEPELVALSWLKAKGVIPILGARTFEQIEKNLKAAEIQLTQAQVSQLDRASTVPMGYPHDFNNAPEHRTVLTGGKMDKIIKPDMAVR